MYYTVLISCFDMRKIIMFFVRWINDFLYVFLCVCVLVIIHSYLRFNFCDWSKYLEMSSLFVSFMFWIKTTTLSSTSNDEINYYYSSIRRRQNVGKKFILKKYKRLPLEILHFLFLFLVDFYVHISLKHIETYNLMKFHFLNSKKLNILHLFLFNFLVCNKNQGNKRKISIWYLLILNKGCYQSIQKNPII